MCLDFFHRLCYDGSKECELKITISNNKSRYLTFCTKKMDVCAAVCALTMLFPDCYDNLIQGLMPGASRNRVFKNKEEGDFNPEPANYEDMSLPEARDAFEKKYIQSAVERCNGSIAKAAGVLGIHRSLLYKKMEKYGLRG